ncbi:hypothetical protein [Microcella alkalica]|uniref:hypothetical protein n=1 Tax=Microcella alkalica TaxID=355930 RepID=UPI00145F602E|nr:hypothetical protein [Microcella alkalica]
MIARLLATGALAGALVLTGSAAAFAAEYTGGSVNTNTVAAGGTVTFTSVETGLDEGTDVTASLTCGSTVTAIDGVTVGADGIITFTATVPAGTTGSCTLSVSADDGVDTYLQTLSLTVAAAPVDGGAGDGLAETGAADLTPVLWFGAGAVVLGAAAAGVVAATRRRSAAQ